MVRTSRCGRDNPGSTPGVDILFQNTCEKKLRRSEAEALSRSGSCNAPRFQKRGLGIEPRTFGLLGRRSATELPWLGYFLLPLLLALSNHAFVGHAGHDFVCGQNALPHKNPQRSVHCVELVRKHLVQKHLVLSYLMFNGNKIVGCAKGCQ